METSILDQTLLNLTSEDVWRVRDACEGVQIFGGIGSGKSSGSGKALAKAFLRAGFGGLVLTAKPDESELWQRYCSETGRSRDLKIFSPSSEYRFNFLNYEQKRPGRGAGKTENLVNLLYTIVEAGDRSSGKSSGNDAYWEKTLKQLLRNMFDLLRIAKESITLEDMYNLVQSAPTSNEQLSDENWKKNSFCYHLVEAGDSKPKSERERKDFELSARYWFSEFANLAAKTRSIIVSSFTSLADPFLRGDLNELFCTTTNITPDETHEGKIIVVDLPVKEYLELGKYAQVIFKYLWQQAIERRSVGTNTKPVFLWADEAQNFVTSYDMHFQATARSSRACTVFITQNLPNYYAELGGEDAGKSFVDSLVGNLQTKIFHQNSDPTTNNWAADVFGKSLQFRVGGGSTRRDRFGVDVGGRHTTRSTYEVEEYDVMPQEFTYLMKGGPENNLETEAYIFNGGRRWKATGKNSLKVVFKQDLR